jgi:chromosome partitioning protein
MAIISIASYKGGAAKTTTAIHIAAYMQTIGPTILGDGDIVRASVKWASRGLGVPFKVVPVAQLAMETRSATFEHIVIDAEANPSDQDFKDIAKGCNLLIIPTEADSTARDGLVYTLAKLRDIGHKNHKVLITKAPPSPQTAALKLREELQVDNIPLFKTDIPLLAAFKKASAQGTTVAPVKADRNAWKGAMAYRRVGMEIVGE